MRFNIRTRNGVSEMGYDLWIWRRKRVWITTVRRYANNKKQNWKRSGMPA